MGAQMTVEGVLAIAPYALAAAFVADLLIALVIALVVRSRKEPPA
jgi:hypothetical protein